MDVTEFIAWPGDGTGMRYELVDGALRAMAPASDAHNTIVSNLNGLLYIYLMKSRPGCRVVAGPGVQPRIRAEWNFRIPDLGVTCAANVPHDVFTPEPILLVEVLSPSNTADTSENIWTYTTLPSVQEILVVHSVRQKAELLTRDATGNWPANPVIIEPGSNVVLASIGATLPFAEIYAGTHLV